MKFLLLVYNLLFPLVLLALLPGALLRMLRRGNYARKFGQRLGFYARQTRELLLEQRGEWVWIHAVSVGEVLIALRFIRELQSRRKYPVLLSTTTSTGFAVAEQAAAGAFEVIYHPVDFLPVVRRVVEWVRPRALVLVEAEIWPNLVHGARRMGAKVVMINARLSVRSERRYRCLRRLASILYRLPHKICLQEEGDVGRFQGIGADPGTLEITGSIKFDQTGDPPPDPEPCADILRRIGINPGCAILLGASTHPGEEAILARACRVLRRTRPDLFLVLVPRHAERGDSVARELTGLGFSVARCSKGMAEPCDILLVDTTGDLRRWTAMATLVFVGKSLRIGGGQNPAEAIAAGKPVLFGPQMQNFAALVDLVMQVRGACQISGEAELETSLAALLDDPAAASAMAGRATAALAPHAGATQRSVDLLNHLLDSRESEPAPHPVR